MCSLAAFVRFLKSLSDSIYASAAVYRSSIVMTFCPYSFLASIRFERNSKGVMSQLYARIDIKYIPYSANHLSESRYLGYLG